MAAKREVVAEAEKAVRIAHLSDLHFGGSKVNRDAWTEVAEHLKYQVAPDLLLITGDIVDTPSKRNFATAIKALNAVEIPYYVCPGNHDIHWRGNKIPLKSHDTRFYKEFAACFPMVPGVVDKWYGKELNRWKLRLVACDSSAEARWSAKAFLSKRVRDQIENIRNIVEVREAPEPPDLVIMLMHHHLLPVRHLESEHQSVRHLFDLTASTNPGRILETLATAHIDVVLHGHPRSMRLLLASGVPVTPN